MKLINRKNGAIVGWMIGDALGTTVEFEKSLNAKKIILAYSHFDNGLVGGGVFNLAPGQFTDDTEMGLANMFGIKKIGHYDSEETAKKYHSWYLSKPFDIGTTTIKAVSKQNASEMFLIAKTLNYSSLSNGFLMRLPGLISLYMNQPPEKLIDVVVMDVQLTHGNPEAVNIAVIYSMILYKALHGEDVNAILHYTQKKRTQSILFNQILISIEQNMNYFVYNNHIYQIKEIDGKEMGFVGYAMWLLLWSLTRYKSYRSAMLDIAERGGDSDTNCCIVGAVMGALYPETIPPKWIDSLLSCKCERHQSYPLSDPKNWIQFLD